MESVLVFEFEHCVELHKQKEPVSMRDICFRPLPDAHFKSSAAILLHTARSLYLTTVLVAYGDQVLVKEALLKLNACPLFCDILILDELVDDPCPDRKAADRILSERYGNSYRYTTDFGKVLV